MFESGICLPLFLKKILIFSREALSRKSFLLKNFAPISFDKSSSVGPKPPVVIIISARSKPILYALKILSGLSPTTV